MGVGGKRTGRGWKHIPYEVLNLISSLLSFARSLCCWYFVCKRWAWSQYTAAPCPGSEKAPKCCVDLDILAQSTKKMAVRELFLIAGALIRV